MITNENNQLIDYYALHHKVLAVAKEGNVKDWAAYIGPVPGHCHADEWDLVLADGSKLPYAVAKVLFPHFDEQFQWRR